VQSALSPAGDQATAILGVWNLTLWICLPMYVLVVLALIWSLRQKPDAVPSDQVLTRALLGFVVLTAALLTAMTIGSYVADRRLHASVDDPIAIRITARQWWWQVEYDDPDPSQRFTTANELHLPVDRPARIELGTADVIHSLWIPALGGKEDLIPGRNNVLVLTPRRIGHYRGQCAEFCGLQHAHMALDVQVNDAAAFTAWRTHQLTSAAPPTSASAIAGEKLFGRLACALCHAIQGTDAGGHSGPDLTHIASRRTLAAGTLPLDRATMAAWIIDPQKHKPGATMPAVPLQAQELSAIVDYLMGLQ
jgi:cytochrome c oxidase subunit II